MIRIDTTPFPLYSRQEIWFYKGGVVDFSVNTIFYQSFVQPQFQVYNATEFYTLETDLSMGESELYQKINASYRNEIRRAEKENIRFVELSNPKRAYIKELVNDYKAFAEAKKIQPLSMKRMIALCPFLFFTEAYVGSQKICTHCYIMDKDEGIVRLLLSFNHSKYTDGKMRGFANKALHWFDLRCFKEKDFKKFDWGGISLDEGNSIAKFKEGFGGERKVYYTFEARRGWYKLLKKAH